MNILDGISDKNPDLDIQFEIEACKNCDVFYGMNCIPCPINTFYPLNDLSGSSFQCPACNKIYNFNCYGSDQRSPKKNYWRLSQNSNSFLRCPSSK